MATPKGPQAQQQPNTQIQQAQTQQLSPMQRKVLDLGQLIEKKRDALALVAGQHFDATRLVKLGQAAITRNPKIATCNTATVLVCLMRAAELNLEPDAALPQRRMWLVPRQNNKLPEGMELTYVIDYRAKMQVARDTGLVDELVADTVRVKDKFTFRRGGARGDGEEESVGTLTHEYDPFATEAERGPVRGFYAYAYVSGRQIAVAWSHERMVKFMNRYAPKKGGALAKSPWTESEESFEAMAKKTMTNQLFNFLPAGQSPEAKRLQEITHEETVAETKGMQTSTGAVDLGIEIREDDGDGTTDSEVEGVLAGGRAAGAKAAEDTLAPGKDPKAMDASKGKGEPGADG